MEKIILKSNNKYSDLRKLLIRLLGILIVIVVVFLGFMVFFENVNTYTTRPSSGYKTPS